MKLLMAVALVAVLSGASASAQSASPPDFTFYAEGVAQSAFGNVTSQSYGGEIGVRVAPRLDVFFDGGQTRNTAGSTLFTNAQLIASGLSATQSNVSFDARQPVNFGVVGVRYTLPLTGSRLEPYVTGGGGIAQVKRNVTFAVGSNDITNNLPQYGAVLGDDLSGHENDGMFTVGAGVVWPAWQQLIVDFQYRYGRVFAQDAGINVNRAGIGIGVRF